MSGSSTVRSIGWVARRLPDCFGYAHDPTSLWCLLQCYNEEKCLGRRIEDLGTGNDRSAMFWPRFEAGTRRYVLRKFPYNIIYREIPVGIEVVAVAHHSGALGTGLGVCVGTAELERLELARRRLLEPNRARTASQKWKPPMNPCH